jgi:hypothetical protein
VIYQVFYLALDVDKFWEMKEVLEERKKITSENVTIESPEIKRKCTVY